MNLQGTGYHPDFGQLVEYRAIPLSRDGDRQVAQTIDVMKQAEAADRFSLPVMRDAQLMDSGSGDLCTDAFWWAKGKVKFQQDEQTAAPFRHFLDDDVVEVLIRPRDLADMANPVEDCDGIQTYAKALLAARGIPCSFVTVAADAREPGRYSHVYLACYPNGGERIALDPSHGPYPGWEAPNMFGKRKEWDGPNWGETLLIAMILAGVWYAVRHWGVL